MGKSLLQKIGAVGMVFFLVVSGCGIMPVVNATTQESQSEADTTPTVTSVQVNPGNVSMARGTSYEFAVTVAGNNNPNTTVSWAVGGAKSSGTRIQSNGILTVSAEETATTLTITAISNQNSSVQGSAQVTLTGGNHTVTLQASPSAGGTVSGGGSVSINGSCTVIASANSGYLFTGWEMDGNTVSTSNTYTISNVTTDKVLVANFKKNTMKVTLKVNNSKWGTVTGGGTIAYGGSMSLRATANDGYAFKNWTENNKSISTDKNMTLKEIKADRTITANFVESDFDVKLSVNPKNAGTVSGAGNFDAGKDVTIKAKAGDEYTFVSWSEDTKIISYKESYTIDDIDKDRTLVANFKKREKQTYTIDATVANEGGTISPSGKSNVTEGNNVIYTIAPKDGYKILAVAVDNQQVGTNSSYTFENVKASHAIVAAFVKKETSATVTPDTTVTPNKQGMTNTTGNTQTVTPQTNNNTQTNQTTANSSSTQSSQATTGKPSTQSSQSTNQSKPATQTSHNAGNSSSKIETVIEGSEGTQNKDNSQDIVDTNRSDVIDETQLQAGEEQEKPEILTGILQTMNVTEADAKNLIQTEQDRDLIRTACNHNYMQVKVINDYATGDQYSVNPTDQEDVSVSNFYDVLQASFTEEEKLKAFKGTEVDLNVKIAQADQTISQKDQEAIDEAAKKTSGLTVGQYFDVTVNKTVQGQTESVTDMSKEMEIVLRVPTELKGKNREFCVIRSHQNADGSALVSVIKDMDSDVDTITFRSDKFSAYAIAYVQQSGMSGTQKQILVAVILMLSLTIMITIVYTFVNYIAQRKYHRK